MPFVKTFVATTIRTTIGHCIEVPADTPTYVPPEALRFASMYGCAECTESGELVGPKPKEPKPPVDEVPQLTIPERDDPKLRAAAIAVGIAKIYQDNHREDFTIATNQPKVKAVERVVGFPVTAQELSVALEKFQADS